jgi:hypothetical protein
MFCGTEGSGSHFHVLRSQISFRRYRGRKVLFSCLALLDSFWPVPRAQGLVFLSCAHRFIFDGTKGVECRFHVLRSRTRFGRYRGGQVQFSCFALPDSISSVLRRQVLFSLFALPNYFSAAPRRRVPFLSFVLQDTFSAVSMASGPVFTFCALEPFCAVLVALGPVLIFCALEIVLGGFEGVGSHFHVLCSLTHF